MDKDPQTPPGFDPVEAAVAEIAQGRLVIVTDDEDRENEGDLVMAASKATSESVNVMIRQAGGLICVPTVEPQLKRLGINDMVQTNREQHRTAFTVSVDAAEGITTGISAHDRARTIRILADPEALPEQLVQPGHVFPLRARPGGVLERAGHTEAAVDLASLAGLHPSGVVCEILNEDGTLARLPELRALKEKLGLKMVSIAQLIRYRHERERLVERVLTRPFPSRYGHFDLHVFQALVDRRYHFALSMGQLDASPTLVRVHGENILRDFFGELTHGDGTAVQTALEAIARAGRGVFLLMTHPCGGLRLPERPQAGVCELPVADMDFRGYGLGAQILTSLGLKRIRLMTHSARRIVALEGYGLEVVEQILLREGAST